MLKATAHRRLRGGVAFATTLVMAIVTPVLATHEPPRLGLTPVGEPGSFFELTLGAGDTVELRVEVANFGHEELLARTFSADVYSIINGGFGAALHGEPRSGPTRWLQYPAQEVTLGPDEGLVIDFSVSVPSGTPPGEYIAALVAENVEPYLGADGDSVAVKQVNRTAVAVAIDVPGVRDPGLEIGAVGHKSAAGSSFVSFVVRNSGNVHLKPAGEWVLRDAAGRDLSRAPAVMDSVYAASKTLFEAPLTTILAPGDYCAELALTDPKTGATDATECLPFMVGAPDADVSAREGGATTIPVLQPAVDALGRGWLPAVLIVAMGLAVVIILVLFLRRRTGTTQAPATIPSVLGALLIEVPEVNRAWLTTDDQATAVLVVELAQGVGPDDGSQIARSLRSSIAIALPRLRLRMRFIQGAGPVARTTEKAAPFYTRSEALRPGFDAFHPLTR